MTIDNREKFSYLAGRYGQLIKFYNVEELCADNISELRRKYPGVLNSPYSIATFYRFFVSQIFSPDIEKVIYLDSDIIVNLDIAELWKFELGDKIFGIVPTISQNIGMDWMNQNFQICRDGLVKIEDYFNAGVLLMNLKAFRQEESSLSEGIKFVAAHPEYSFFDQDVLNYCFANRVLKLPNTFNRYVVCARAYNEKPERKIYHYVGQNIYWSFGLDMKDSFNRLWMDYFVKTPFFDAESIGRLYESFNQIYVELKKSVEEFSLATITKPRSFIILEKDFNNLVENFPLKNDEEVFVVNSDINFKKLIHTINSSLGEKIFVIMIPNFSFNVLTAAGFVENRDFIDGTKFLFNTTKLPLYSHQMLKAM